MRRTTQWAVFTSMNQQQPTWRSMYEAAEHDAVSAPDAPDANTIRNEPPARPAPDTRRDRVELM